MTLCCFIFCSIKVDNINTNNKKGNMTIFIPYNTIPLLI